jgi:hypothetical protein
MKHRAALAAGRRSLATMLLDLEPLAGDQVSAIYLLLHYNSTLQDCELSSVPICC